MSRRRVGGALALAVGLVGLGLLFAGTAPADPCDNGANSSSCTVPLVRVPLPPALGDHAVSVGPINANGDASCVEACAGPGVGPIALGGDASCTSSYGCGGPDYTGLVMGFAPGTGPVAVGGNSSCNSVEGCGHNGGTGPVAVGGDASCASWLGCGSFGTGPVAVGGSATCRVDRSGCGDFGTGAIALGGDASCQVEERGGADERGCGYTGTAPIALGGTASCTTYDGCGSTGTGPIAVGEASCRTSHDGCGHMGTGPVATGDVTCEGTCGAAGFAPLIGVPLPRTGTPGVSLFGHAYCATPFNLAAATDPPSGIVHVREFQCVSPRDALGLS